MAKIDAVVWRLSLVYESAERVRPDREGKGGLSRRILVGGLEIEFGEAGAEFPALAGRAAGALFV